jgi:hypothetical protein
MMTPIGRMAPTSNFFAQGGYQRNPIVHNRTGAQLLAQLDERMDVHIKKAGAVEFIAVFDALLSGQPQPQSPSGQTLRPERPAVTAPAPAPLFQTMQ